VSLDMVAKSVEEALLWVRTLRFLIGYLKQGKTLEKLTMLDVGVKYYDRNRPQSKLNGAKFVRANDAQNQNVDPTKLKEIEKEMKDLQKLFKQVTDLMSKPQIMKSEQYPMVSKVLADMEERIEELTHEVRNTRDTELSKRDVWRATVDLTAIQEKAQVLIKESKNAKRNSSIW